MGPEANIDAIQALEKQIEEGKGNIIKLKRDRNSLLNISTRVPPEILGHIFAWRLVRESPFQGLQKGSYSFLLVCHHWFEVASRTPELWSFWGNTFQDWKKRHHRSGATPLDLVFDEWECDPDLFDESLQGAIRNRVKQDTIRRVHLLSGDPHTLASVISSLTPTDVGGRNENIETIALYSEAPPTLDVSNFFARSHLSRLRSLELSGNLRISSWDCLAHRTTLLTSLSLDINASSPSLRPTTAQLFSILTSNPDLQELLLSDTIIPDDAHTSTLKVQLGRLKFLSLAGDSRRLVRLMGQLILPEMLDELSLTIFESTVEDIAQSLAPYMRDYFRRDPRFQNRLGVFSSSSSNSITISVGAVCTQTGVPFLELPQVTLTTSTDRPLPNLLEQLFINLIALIPRERVVYFGVDVDVKPPEAVFSMIPSIEILTIFRGLVSDGFLLPNPNGPHANTKLLPSLRSLRLENVVFLNDNDWSPLTTYLAHQTTDGQTILLVVIGNLPNGCLEVVKGIKGLVTKVARKRYSALEDA